MMRKFFIGCMVLFVLVGCQNEDSTITTKLPNKSVEKVVNLPKNDNEWIDFSKKSSWAANTLEETVVTMDRIAVDFQGDGLPEIIVPYVTSLEESNRISGFILGRYDEEQDEWVMEQNHKQADVNLQYLAYEGVGKLTKVDGKELLVMREETAGAGSVSNQVYLYEQTTEGENLEDLAKISADQVPDITIENNQLSLAIRQVPYTYNFEGTEWLVSGERKEYLRGSENFYKEILMKLIPQHSFMNSHVKIGDDYEKTKNQLDDSDFEVLEDLFICSWYDEYKLCKYSQDTFIHSIDLQLDGSFSIKKVEDVLGEPHYKLLSSYETFWSYYYEIDNLSVEFATENTDLSSPIMWLKISQKL
ncbi:hypothetical protein [Sporosarcina sp. SAFN-010]|uniref:hypothetical protein n=1 Tax=Sporosarcina sp. SAFN-010 TaxID=3387273 RepID=UPI003F7D919C